MATVQKFPAVTMVTYPFPVSLNKQAIINRGSLKIERRREVFYMLNHWKLVRDWRLNARQWMVHRQPGYVNMSRKPVTGSREVLQVLCSEFQFQG